MYITVRVGNQGGGFWPARGL